MKLKHILSIACVSALLFSCEENAYLEDVYVQPEAEFTTEKDTYEVFESVVFTNAGSGQNYVVYTGDPGHVYGEPGSTGFATASNGTFSYAYNEPGEYTVVWIASSVSVAGDIEKDEATSTIKVVSTDGGLDKLTISKLYKMTEYGSAVYYEPDAEFVSATEMKCPILFAAWRDASFNSIKAKQLLSFQLSSTLASFYWMNPNTNEYTELKSDYAGSRIVEFVQDGKLAVQKFKVVTASGYETEYELAPVMIPQFTKFSVNGVDAKITRDIAYYDRYNVELTLPEGTDLKNVVPVFEVMNNDPNLVDGTNVLVTVGGQIQQSGVTAVDLSSGEVVYTVKSQLMGSTNEAYSETAEMVVKIK